MKSMASPRRPFFCVLQDRSARSSSPSAKASCPQGLRARAADATAENERGARTRRRRFGAHLPGARRGRNAARANGEVSVAHSWAGGGDARARAEALASVRAARRRIDIFAVWRTRATRSAPSVLLAARARARRGTRRTTVASSSCGRRCAAPTSRLRGAAANGHGGCLELALPEAAALVRRQRSSSASHDILRAIAASTSSAPTRPSPPTARGSSRRSGRPRTSGSSASRRQRAPSRRRCAAWKGARTAAAPPRSSAAAPRRAPVRRARGRGRAARGWRSRSGSLPRLGRAASTPARSRHARSRGGARRMRHRRRVAAAAKRRARPAGEQHVATLAAMKPRGRARRAPQADARAEAAVPRGADRRPPARGGATSTPLTTLVGRRGVLQRRGARDVRPRTRRARAAADALGRGRGVARRRGRAAARCRKPRGPRDARALAASCALVDKVTNNLAGVFVEPRPGPSDRLQALYREVLAEARRRSARAVHPASTRCGALACCSGPRAPLARRVRLRGARLTPRASRAARERRAARRARARGARSRALRDRARARRAPNGARTRRSSPRAAKAACARTSASRAAAAPAHACSRQRPPRASSSRWPAADSGARRRRAAARRLAACDARGRLRVPRPPPAARRSADGAGERALRGRRRPGRRAVRGGDHASSTTSLQRAALPPIGDRRSDGAPPLARERHRATRTALRSRVGVAACAVASPPRALGACGGRPRLRASITRYGWAPLEERATQQTWNRVGASAAG